jgi:hypothetical protein
MSTGCRILPRHFLRGKTSSLEVRIRELMVEAKQCLATAQDCQAGMQDLIFRLENCAEQAESAGFVLSAQELDKIAVQIERHLMARTR